MTNLLTPAVHVRGGVITPATHARGGVITSKNVHGGADHLLRCTYRGQKQAKLKAA